MEHSKKSYLSDANSQLINTYIQVRDNPEELIEYFKAFPNTESDYYRIREEITRDNTVVLGSGENHQKVSVGNSQF